MNANERNKNNFLVPMLCVGTVMHVTDMHSHAERGNEKYSLLFAFISVYLRFLFNIESRAWPAPTKNNYAKS